jgi:S-DNA-T family DNA segregation ATPase FtsK/SpoIIIE
VKKTGKISSERKCEILGVIVLGLTALLFLALMTDEYSGQDESARALDGMMSVPNLLGAPGAMIAGVLAVLVGDGAHVLYALTFIWGLMLFTHRPLTRLLTRFVGFLILTGAVAGLLQVDMAAGRSNPYAGGLFGSFVADQFLERYFGLIGANVIGVTMAVIGILLATDFLFVHAIIAAEQLLVHFVRGNLALFDGVRFLWRRHQERAAARSEKVSAREKGAAPVVKGKSGRKKNAPAKAVEEVLEAAAADDLERIKIRSNSPETTADEPGAPFDAIPEVVEVPSTEESPKAVALELEADEVQQMDLVPEEPPAPKPKANRKREPRMRRKAREVDAFEQLPADYVYPKRYTIPAISMLDKPVPTIIPNLDEQLRTTSVVLEETLLTFGIEAQVTDVTRGPTITRFELEPASGIKVSRFLALSDDIALALKAHRVRVEAPIPGKGRVGIEVPNADRDPVLVRELLDHRSFKKGKGILNAGGRRYGRR